MEHRTAFDFEVRFTNGGDLVGHDFRMDIPGDEVTDAWIADALVRDLRLLMVDAVRISNRRTFAEAHKRGVGRPSDAPTDGAWRRIVDVSHPIVEGMTTYPGLPTPSIRPHLRREDSA